MADMKKCSKCGTEKPLEEFHIHKKSKDGHKSICKACTAAYMAAYNKKAGKPARRERPKPAQEAPETKAEIIEKALTPAGIERTDAKKMIMQFVLNNLRTGAQQLLEMCDRVEVESEK